MKILQLTYESLGSPFGFGGAGVRAYEIYKRLRDRHEITLLCLRYPGVCDGYIEGIKHIFVGTESNNRTKSVFFYTLSASCFLRRYGENFDVIIENFLPAIPYCSRLITKTPVVLQVQGIMGSHSLRKFNLLHGLPMYIVEKIYPLLYDTFIYVTKTTGGSAAGDRPVTGSPRGETGGFSMKGRKMFSVIPNGINSELLNVTNKEEDDYILFLSRIDIYTKGLDILFEAFQRIASRFQKVKLILAGYEFNSTANLIKRLPAGLRDRVQYAGFVTGQEKLDLLSRAKVFVLPSRHEAHPVSVLEAMACGKAVLVSDIPELRYIGDGGLGMTFQNRSPRDLSEKLSLLLGDSDIRHGLADKGREYASRFLWDDLALKFERFLSEVVDIKGRKT